MGHVRVFEFKECFRNGELSQNHQPEFLMLEWYRCYEGLEKIMDDIDGLLGLRCQRVEMSQLWEDVLHFDLKPQTSSEDISQLARELAIGEGEKDFDDLFNLIFLEKIEPYLKAKNYPVIVWKYPPSQASPSPTHV